MSRARWRRLEGWPWGLAGHRLRTWPGSFTGPHGLRHRQGLAWGAGPADAADRHPVCRGRGSPCTARLHRGGGDAGRPHAGLPRAPPVGRQPVDALADCDLCAPGSRARALRLRPVGNARRRYGERLAPEAANAPRLPALPSAAALLRLAPAGLAAGTPLPASQALPLYVRDKVAQTTAERAGRWGRPQRRPPPPHERPRRTPPPSPRLGTPRASRRCHWRAWMPCWTSSSRPIPIPGRAATFIDTWRLATRPNCCWLETRCSATTSPCGGAGRRTCSTSPWPRSTRARAGRAMLLEALNAWARSCGAQSLWLEVRKSNTRAPDL